MKLTFALAQINTVLGSLDRNLEKHLAPEVARRPNAADLSNLQ